MNILNLHLKSVFNNPPLYKAITNIIQDSCLYVSWFSCWKSGAQANCDVASWFEAKDDRQSKGGQKDYEDYEVDWSTDKEIPETEEQGQTGGRSARNNNRRYSFEKESTI